VAPADAPLIVVTGPTASGKSALGLRIARERSGEIVSCDSQQVYRGMDVGTAKPTAADRRAVPHHLLDVADPGDAFSAAEYGRLARAALAAIRERGSLPVVVGGTGLYLRALLRGLFEGPARDDALRARLAALADRHGDARLHRLLSRVDPATAGRTAPRDRVRVVRALEVFFRTGRPISAEHRTGAVPLAGFRVLRLGLDPGREALRRSIAERTRRMFERGLVDEVRRLLAGGLSPDARPLHSIGYRQALAVARGEWGPAQAEAATVAETVRFAKRQRTWFRHQEPGILWFADPGEAFTAALAWLDGPPEGAPIRGESPSSC
jgi:tRNA dimethylallyltransferase